MPTRQGTAPPGEATKTLIEHVYRKLKSDIIYGRRNPGAKLPIEELRALYGVSSSTMREALSLLIADALVTAEGQRGFKVAPISLEDFREITNLRKIMETIALRESIARGDAGWEADVIAAFQQLDLIDIRKMRRSEELAVEWSGRNHALHEALVAASPSRWVRHFRRILYQNSERYRALHLVVLNVRPGIRQEHKAIVEAAMARDADLACRLTEEHIDRTFDALAARPIATLQRNPQEIDPSGP